MKRDFCDCYDSSRGVTRLDGAQGKKQVWPCSNLKSFGSKCTVLKKVFVTLLGLYGAPAVIWRPHIDTAPGELCPPCPPRYVPV